MSIRRASPEWQGRSAIPEAPTAPPRQSGQAIALLRDAIGRSAGRFCMIVVISVLTATLESTALILLPTLLGMRSGSAMAWRFLLADRLAPPTLLALYAGLLGLAAALLYAQTVLSSRLTLEFGARLRMRLHEALMRAGWGTPALARPADLVHALTSEAAQSANATQTAVQLAARVVYLPSFLAAALILSPRLAAAVLALSLTVGLPMLVLARRAYASAADMTRAAQRLHRDVADDLAGLKVIKALRAEPARHAALRDRIDEANEASHGQSRAIAAVQAWQRFAAATIAAAGAIYGLSVLRLDGAAMLALAFALARLASNVSQALDLWRQLGRLLPVYGQFRACEERCRAAAEPSPAATAPRLRRELRLRGVGFSYPGASVPTLAGIDLVLPAFSITALTGPSGAGKSTLADLVMGLTAPTAGDILVDGAPLDGPARAAWRGNVAYVPQDPFLFHETISANLRLAKPDARDADLQRALDAAAASFVRNLPQGLETVVGERGSRLSGGERQRLMIARALLREPDLLVLDEATNALDPVSEAAIIASLRRLASRTTILVIAHRSSIIAAADSVLRLDGGTIGPCERHSGLTEAEGAAI